MNPESFEPTPRQMIDLNRSQLIFNIGWIDFEQNMLSKIEDRRKVIDLHRGIEPIAGSCSHADAEKEHRHGVDPHIWTSPRELRTMADNAYRAIHELYPDSTVYAVNYQCLADKLQALDDSVAERLKQSGVPYFMIYHPALTYYARAYGIEQVAIEQDGKEPSAKRLARLIEQARRDSIRVVFYQSQFPASTVEVIAEDIGAQSVRIDPLAEDVVGNISYITDLITAERL
ncbi:metal ABC transporter solute-binding protein, Zn/Mn family, partial [Alistipes putredinis]